MGVTGLWRLLDPAGKPIPVEALEGKVLAVDISIWLHQVVKGYRDGKGAALGNAHLIGLFNRLCKLLYYRIKPVFVFDGDFPPLKKETIMRRRKTKTQIISDAEKLRKQLLEILIKQNAIHNVIKGKDVSPKKKLSIDQSEDDLFKLPPINIDQQNEMEESENDSQDCQEKDIDLHTYDINSEEFKKLTPHEKYDLLSELKETRKQNSWGKLHELPPHSNTFAEYQMNRLLKRRDVQVKLEETEKEIGGRSLSINELEILLNEEGISTKIDHMPTRRIASDDTTHYFLVKDIKETIQKYSIIDPGQSAKKTIDADDTGKPSTSQEVNADLAMAITPSTSQEFNADLEMAITLSLQENWESVANHQRDSKRDLVNTDESSDEEFQNNPNNLAAVKGFMLENCGLTMHAIEKIMKSNKGSRVAKKKQSNHNKKQPIHIEPPSNNILKFDRESSPSASELKLCSTKKVQISQTINPEVIERVKSLNSINSDGSLEEDLSINISCPNEQFYSTMENTKKNNLMLESNQRKKIQLANETTGSVVINDIQYNHKTVISSDTDDDLEEVLDSETEVIKNDLQLELPFTEKFNVKEDIFADIFMKSSNPIIKEFIHNDLKNKMNSARIQTEIQQIQIDEKLLVLDRERHASEKTIIPSDLVKEISEKIKEEPVSTELNKLVDDLEVQKSSLEIEQNKINRMGRNITEEMTNEAKLLLKMFGIPYVEAPMEAEAQCAYMEIANLTHGTITDDSDIWLFGGKTVYKNFFDNQKYVLQFLEENISKCFKLQRGQLILLAFLLGSDYTLGINGVGPVTGMEILAAFPSSDSELKPPYADLLSGLKRFKSWWKTSRGVGHENLRKKLKNIVIADDFPDRRVVRAYHMPDIDANEEPFTWGHLDLISIRDFARRKFGWSGEKIDEILNPVLERINRKNSQSSIRPFFKIDIRNDVVGARLSERVLRAIERIEGASSEPSEDLGAPDRIGGRKPGIDTDRRDCSTSSTRPRFGDSVPAKEKVPQKRYREEKLSRNRAKAIEIFQKSKKIPDFIRKRRARARPPKPEAELSESGDSDK